MKSMTPVISALSNCVTWGTIFQEVDVPCAVRRRTVVISSDSISPQRLKSGIGRSPTETCPAVGDISPATIFLTCALTSSIVIRPPGPVPATSKISAPSSRARRRTDGDAGAGLRSGGVSSSIPTGGAFRATGAAGFGDGTAAGAGAGSGGGVGSVAVGGGGSGAAATAAPSVSIRAITAPIFTVSPSLARTSVIVPLTGDGISTTALSVSNSIMPSSTSTRSPTLTRIATTCPDSIFSPTSGTRDFLDHIIPSL